jgi:2-isopropylmalate synthase
MPTDPERVIIFDTTLRDGEQAPGCGMTQSEKLRVARALAELGVDVIEAGFPAGSRGDWDSVNAVAQQVHGPVICALARCIRADIELAAGALLAAPRRRLHVYLGTSAIFREQKLHMTPAQVISTAVTGVATARELCSDVEFSPEDASRTELEFLVEVIERVIEAGATTINIPDTMGYTVPDEFSELFRYLRTNVRGIEQVTLSVHCHDDLGMAVANSLTAVVAGARQIECTINGIGERAGNCSLEEVVMALRTRTAFFNLATQVRTTRLYPVSRLVSNITGVLIPRNKAVVGESAVLGEDVGLPRSTLALGRHSDREALRGRLQALGFELAAGEFEQVFVEFKALAERKKELFDGDLEALVLRVEGSASGASAPAAARRAHRPRSICAIATAAASSRRRAGMDRWMRPSWPWKRPPACRSACANSKSVPSARARTPRARRWSMCNTAIAAIVAPAPVPISSRRVRAPFSKSSTASS